MAALTYAAVLGLERVSGRAGRHGEKGRMGRREVGGRGAPVKAASEPLSDGLSTQHSCFRQSQGSGGSSGPFHLHMAFLRSRPSGMLALLHFTPSATHRPPHKPPSLLSHKLYEIPSVLPTCWFLKLQCEYRERTFGLWKSQFMAATSALCPHAGKVHSLSVVCVRAVRWMQIGRWEVAGRHSQEDVGRNEKQYKLEDIQLSFHCYPKTNNCPFWNLWMHEWMHERLCP